MLIYSQQLQCWLHLILTVGPVPNFFTVFTSPPHLSWPNSGVTLPERGSQDSARLPSPCRLCNPNLCTIPDSGNNLSVATWEQQRTAPRTVRAVHCGM